MTSVCLYLYLLNSNLVFIYLCHCYCFVHQAWVPRNPPGNNPMPGLVYGWLCWELKILWKCHQPLLMYSLVSSLIKELTSLLSPFSRSPAARLQQVVQPCLKYSQVSSTAHLKYPLSLIAAEGGEVGAGETPRPG